MQEGVEAGSSGVVTKAVALPINIDDLIRHRRVESARIEYKKDWNPERVLHSVCAFANDIDNWGGGCVILKAYDIPEPIVVTVTPECLTIDSVPGIDRSISDENIKRLQLVTTRYRNRRIGEFLKELDLAEGRNTGMPAIIRACEGNGSPLPRFETDDDRRQLRVVLPIHPAFRADYKAPDGENNPFAVQKSQSTTEKTSEKGGLKGGLKSSLKSGLNKTDVIIVDGIESNAKSTILDLMGLTGLSRNGVRKALDRLKSAGIIRRVGPDKGGHWEVVG